MHSDAIIASSKCTRFIGVCSHSCRGMEYKLLTILCALTVRAEEFFNTTPHPINSNFSCAGRKVGFFADVAENCRIYYTCDDQGNKFTYHCPEETAFRQDALICDYAHLVDCARGVRIGKSLAVDNGKRPDFNPFLGNTYTRTTKSPIFNAFAKKSTTQQLPNTFYVTQKPFAFNTTPRSFQNKYTGFGAGISQNHETTKSLLSSQNNHVVTQVTKPFFNFQTADGKSGQTKSSVNVQNVKGPSQTTQSLFQRNGSRTGTTNRFPNFPSSFRKSETVETSFKYSSNREESFYAQRSNLGHTESNSNLPKDKNTESTTSRFANYSPVGSTGLSSSFPNNNYPYSETLRSIQNNTPLSSTTPSTSTVDGSSDAFTASLKPLVPNEPEFDPYYPKDPSTTEAYYTPSGENIPFGAFQVSTQRPFLGVQFEIPAVLPDLNGLEDLVDRRKLFYIPRIKSA